MVQDKNEFTSSDFIEILEAVSDAEIVMIKSILDQTAIKYYFQNESGYGESSSILMVEKENEKTVKELLKNLNFKGWTWWSHE